MPKFGPTIKSLLTNKDKLSELARTSLNEHCSAVLLKKLPEKLGDPGKFLIPYDFPRMDEYIVLADLGASINLMPLSVWNKLSLPELSSTCMNLKLADRLISRPVEVAEDVFIKTELALIDVYEGELTLHVGNKAITFNLDQTSVLSRSSWIFREWRSYSIYGITCHNFFSYSHSLRDNDFLLEETDAFLAIDDEPISPEIDGSYYDSEGDIFLLEEFINDDPSSPPLPPQELKVVEPTNKRSSINEPLVVEIKDLLPHLEFAFLGGIDPEFYTHKIIMEDDFKPTVQHQRRSFGEPRALYSKKGGFTVVENEENELIPTRLVTGNEYNCFLNGLSGYFQIPIDRQDHKKTIFTCPYGTFAYRRMTFGLCNAPGTFQRCMMAIFHDMIEKTMEVFMDDFSVFGNSFGTCLFHLDKMLKRCEVTNLCLNWEKRHFMVKEGIVLSHKISKNWIEVDKAKVDVIAKLPHPTTVKGIRGFLGHSVFYR
nr:reverse transcriptase domain-containing protein [Tanacetum cinerariifolium]